MTDTPRIVFDFEFHFTSGQLLCVTAEYGRDSIAITDTEIVLKIRPEPGTEVTLTVDRVKLNAFQQTTRPLEPISTIEDAGRLKVVGDMHG